MRLSLGGENLRLDFSSCSPNINRQLLTSAGTVLTGQTSTCADRAMNSLAAGDYRLRIYPSQNRVATYAVSLAWLP